MCSPVALAVASFAIGAAGQVASFMGQQQQYQAQVEQYKRNAENAQTAANIRYNQINTRMLQEGEATAQKKFETRLEAKRAVATARTAAGEGGVAGLSVANLIGDITGQVGRYDSSVDTNLQMTRTYLEGEKDAAAAQGQGQINSVAIPEKPSFLPHLVGIFGSGIDAYTGYQRAIA